MRRRAVWLERRPVRGHPHGGKPLIGREPGGVEREGHCMGTTSGHSQGMLRASLPPSIVHDPHRARPSAVHQVPRTSRRDDWHHSPVACREVAGEDEGTFRKARDGVGLRHRFVAMRDVASAAKPNDVAREEAHGAWHCGLQLLGGSWDQSAMLLGRAIARRAATRDVARSFASQVARARSLAQACRDRPSCATNPATRTGSSRHWACYVTGGNRTRYPGAFSNAPRCHVEPGQ